MDRNVNATLCVLNKDNKTIITKNVNTKHTIFGVWDFSYKFKYVVGDIIKDYYTALINYFSSPAFVKAVKKAYDEENDNLTETNN